MSLQTDASSSRLAGRAYWAMLRRVVVIAGSIDASWLVMYAALGATSLAVFNLASVAMYATAYVLIGRRRNRPAVVLIWTEVLVHAAFGSLAIGWESGFHYFLLIFIPAIVVGTRRRPAILMVALLLGFYVGLDALCAHLGALSPLPALHLQIARWVNILLVFAMFYSMAAYYRSTVIAAEKRLLAMATTDPLTGLANRSQFHVHALSEMARSRRTGQPASLMLADVDYFKRINDAHGHDAGDKVLVRLAELMRGALRPSDVLARWGGEEFIALLPECDEREATALAERVRHAVAAVHIDVEGCPLSVTMSFGVTAWDPSQDLRSTTVRADTALYASKHAGRNRVSVAATQRQAMPFTAGALA